MLAPTGKMFQIIIIILLTMSDVCFSQIVKVCRNRAYKNELCYMAIYDLTNDIAHRSFWIKPTESFQTLTFSIPSSYSSDYLNLEREFQKTSFKINEWNNILCVAAVKGNSSHLFNIEVVTFVNSFYYWKIKFDLNQISDRPASINGVLLRINFYFEGEAEVTDNFEISQNSQCKKVGNEPIVIEVESPGEINTGDAVKIDSINDATTAAAIEDIDVYRKVPNCMMNRASFPVCGSDGNNYSNFDAIKCAQDLEPDLSVAYEGLCKFGDLRKSNNK